MKLVNIYADKRKIYLFSRDENGEQKITIDDSFFPYYYEPGEGTFKSNLGQSLKKIFVSDPFDINKNRTSQAYEADIFIQHRYILDKIDELEKTNIKYSFVDIETLSEEMPNPHLAKDPISSITVSNSQKRHVKTFYLGDFKTEYDMLEAFIKYMKDEKFDMLLAWNMKGFDYLYLYHRIPDFAKRISPIGKERYGDGEVFYPAGISIIDYLAWDKKITLNKRNEYTLDHVLEQELGKGKEHGDVDFSKLSPELKAHNIEDVMGLVKLEEKNKLIPYFDEVRRLAKVEWEDLMWNSRTIDSLLLQEAKRQNVVLPTKPKENEKEDFLGAFREAFETGAMFGVSEYDLASAYPNMIIDFNLDPSNIRQEKRDNCIEIQGTYYEQNKGALLPKVAKSLMILKNKIAQELKSHSVDSQEYKDTNIKYKAIKTIVNSAYGVMGNRFFRLYDKRVAEGTTSLVRNLLHYVKDSLDIQGKKIVYVDTDGVFVDGEDNIVDQLNQLIIQWAQENFKKNYLSTTFDYKGVFEKILILAKCRYVGYLRKPNGEIKADICGVEAKRKDSTVFMKKFQETLIDKILNKENKMSIYNWIKEEIERIKTVPFVDIAFPCRLGRDPDEYKNVPIFLRALNYAKAENPKFDKKVGSKYYYIYVEPETFEIDIVNAMFLDGKKMTSSSLKPYWEKYYNETILVKDMPEDKKETLIEDLITKGNINIQTIEKKGKAKDVMAFDEKIYEHVNPNKINWRKMTERNITMKLEVIFKAMGWELYELI